MSEPRSLSRHRVRTARSAPVLPLRRGGERAGAEVVALLPAPTVQAATDTDTCRRLLASLRPEGAERVAYAPVVVPPSVPRGDGPAAHPVAHPGPRPAPRTAAPSSPGRPPRRPSGGRRPRGTGGSTPPAA